MRILVTGAAGFIGTRLSAALLSRGLADPSGRPAAVRELTLADRSPPVCSDPRARCIALDVADASALESTLSEGFDSVFALAATLTVDAETRFAHGLDVNLRGLLALLEACRRSGKAPRLVFTSSLAAFGGPLPETVDDHLQLTPQTSYGTQKAIGELLVNDYSRHGFIDGRSLRLPIVMVRSSPNRGDGTGPGSDPGAAQPAAPTVSGAIAAIVADRLAGRDVTCPLAPDTRIAAVSVDRVVDALIAIHDAPASAFGHTRSTNLPALSLTLAELAEATDRAALRLGIRSGAVHWAPEPRFQSAVDQWPRRFVSQAAERLGIRSDDSADEIVDSYIRQTPGFAQAAAVATAVPR